MSERILLAFAWRCTACGSDGQFTSDPRETCDATWERIHTEHARVCPVCPKPKFAIERLENVRILGGSE